GNASGARMGGTQDRTGQPKRGAGGAAGRHAHGTGQAGRTPHGARAAGRAGSVGRAGSADPLREEVRRAAGRQSQGVAAAEAFDRARQLLERGKDAAAVQAAAEARTLAPRSGAARELLGLALYRAGKYREALRELQAYRRITGRQDQNHLMADCY